MGKVVLTGRVRQGRRLLEVVEDGGGRNPQTQLPLLLLFLLLFFLFLLLSLFYSIALVIALLPARIDRPRKEYTDWWERGERRRWRRR